MFILDLCHGKEGQVWTPEDTAEVLRQLKRIDDLALELAYRYALERRRDAA